MFVKVTRSGGRSYVKLVEAFRDDAGQPRQRVIATLGRLEQVRAGAADALGAEVTQYIDRTGQSRWFKFSVQPDSQVIVDLAKLVATKDKDMAKAYGL
jgi:hypothetical protein